MYSPTYDSVNKIWSGPSTTSIYYENANLGYLILSVVKSAPDRVFQVCDDTGAEMTSMEMYKRAVKIAKFLSKHGLKQDDVVGYVAEDSENVTPVTVACLLLGLPINPIAPVMNEADIIYMFEKTKPKVIFSDVAVIEKVKNSVKKLDFDCEIFTFSERVEGYQFVNDMIDGDDSVINDFILQDLDISLTPSFILCSSGTTSKIKGISRSHKQNILQCYINNPKLSQPGVCFFPLGPYWSTSVSLLIYNGLFGCKRVISSEKFTPDSFMDILERHKVTSIFCTPSLGENILRSKHCRPLQSITSVAIGGQKFNKNFTHRIQKVFPNAQLMTVYGSTEMDLVTISFRGLKGKSSGQINFNCSAKIVDDSDKALDPFEQGEIIVKTAVPFMNYYGESELYSETVSSDGWVRSGDVGYFDDEGFLFIVDRVKNLLKMHGIHFTTTEIEEVINEVEGVAQSCVVGIIGAHDGFDVTYAFVIKDPVAVDLNESKIIDYVSSKVIEQKRINGGVEFVTKFPLTATGKISTGQLKNLAKEIHEKKKKT